MTQHKIMVLGASGMLGNALLRFLSNNPAFDVRGTVRSTSALRLLPGELQERLIEGVDVTSGDALVALLDRYRPDILVNCIGVVKQLAEAEDPLQALPLNSLLPHRLARLCGLAGARLIHLSTDCVFAGTKGGYLESDTPDAKDLYGRSKLLGEVDAPHTLTLRTSIIGHELAGARSLVNWFLSCEGPVRGYQRAIFSGLSTVEVARVIQDHIIERPDLRGLYHLSADPISKFDLLSLIADCYGKTIEIEPDQSTVIDRSLDSTRFREETGYRPPSWPALIDEMFRFS